MRPKTAVEAYTPFWSQEANECGPWGSERAIGNSQVAERELACVANQLLLGNTELRRCGQESSRRPCLDPSRLPP